MVKIAYIVTPIEFGGAEKVNVTFLKKVNRERFNIHLMILTRPWESKNTFLDYVKNDDFIITKIPVAKRPPSEGRDYLRVARCIKYLYQLLSKSSFDIVHSHGYFADVISTPTCKLLKIPHISTCHGFIANDNHLKLYNMLDRFILRSCNKVIAVSSGIMGDLVKHGMNPSQISVIQNAVQLSDGYPMFEEYRAEKRNCLSVHNKEFLIGFVGRLSEEKGVNFLIEAASSLKQDFDGFKVIIVGDGPKKDELCYQVESKGLVNHILFTGFQNDIEQWFPAFDIFVLPSLTEGTPMALLEAMSMGIPIIASAVGGIPSIVNDGVNGFLVEPGDSMGICKKIRLLIYNSSLRDKFKFAAINTIKDRFDVNLWCRTIEGEYEALLK